MIERKLFYLCEIRGALDSGMTLQVLNDYGHLAQLGWQVTVPVRPEGESLPGARHLSTLAVTGRSQLLRTLRMALAARSSRVIVIRERRHRFVARLLRRLTGALLVSELHEAAFPRPRRGSRRRFQRFLDGLDGLVFTNGSQRDYLVAQGFVVPRENIVLPNGVDYARFAQARPGDGAHVLTYTGQFTPWKNCELLFAALARLDNSYRLRIAGGKAAGDSAAYVDGLARRHGVEGRVDYLGFVDPRELVSRAIDGSSVLLVPLGENDIARHATSPMKLIEYLATGLPVVAVGHPSVLALAGPEIVHTSSSDAADFARAIQAAVSEDAAARATRADKARALARSFDHRERALRLDAWLRSLATACAS